MLLLLAVVTVVLLLLDTTVVPLVVSGIGAASIPEEYPSTATVDKATSSLICVMCGTKSGRAESGCVKAVEQRVGMCQSGRAESRDVSKR